MRVAAVMAIVSAVCLVLPAAVRVSATDLTQYGVQVDLRSPSTTPSGSQLSELGAAWTRFVYTDSSGIGSFPANKIAIINHESAPGAPLGSDDLDAWRDYVDNVYVPKVRAVARGYGSSLAAIEVWNEEDHGYPNPHSNPYYDPYVPPASYQYMLQQAARAVREEAPSLVVVMGGLDSGNYEYVRLVNPSGIAYVGAVGIHPYGKSPDGWRTDLLPFGDLGQAVVDYSIVAGKPIWVTEIGYGTYDDAFQEEYLRRTFAVLERKSVPVVIWYAWIDTMTGGNGQNNWGLYDSSGNIKPSGLAFRQVAAGTSELNGRVLLQGRSNHAGATVSVGGITTRTGMDGSFSLLVAPGTYDVIVTMQGYLYATKRVSVSRGQSLNLGSVTLLGGDANGDSAVNLIDLVIVGGSYNTSPPRDPRADINGDGTVNIFDLVLVGGNYDIRGPSPWP
ncbi:MAG: carboxypeptidase regulatory-like domain-containing protein [Candidatus Brockarchaeota archaeon]|nr:carboxypeptidase regulatory-like domain-containing protein [Candidatus Brockarchaeota archaeon]